MNYNTVRNNFLRGLWNVAMVTMAKKKGVISANQYKAILHDGVDDIITAEEYEALTGEAYEE